MSNGPTVRVRDDIILLCTQEMSTCFSSNGPSHPTLPPSQASLPRGELLTSNLDMGLSSRAGGHRLSRGMKSLEGKVDQEKEVVSTVDPR